MKPVRLKSEHGVLTRRGFLQIAPWTLLAVSLISLPAYASFLSSVGGIGQETASGVTDLVIREQTMNIAGREATATTINGSLPGPLLRFREGETATIRVTNTLKETTSIHWHGLLVPSEMDGVPDVSFPGIKPGETFTYRFTLRQSGTYWYHSHSGMQEQTGMYGPLLIESAEREVVPYDQEYVVMLSDWTFEDPKRVLAKLKKSSSYYNFNQRTVADFFRDAWRNGWGSTIAERLMWGRMRMNPTDILDVTGYTYTYLINGLSPELNWTALFKAGERVRLRFVNAAAMTFFDVRIPGLKMTVISADGQNVQPITIEEFRIGNAETYDVIVEPQEDQAYTIFAETMDRSGYASATLAPRAGMRAPIPPRRARPLRTMADMGMSSESMANGKRQGMSGMTMASGEGGTEKTGSMPGMEMPAMEMPAEGASGSQEAAAPAMHGPDHHGPGNSMVAMRPASRLNEPGIGLDGTERRVLVYTDLRRLAADDDPRKPERDIELHLTGNMERFMWSIDGKKYSEASEPIPLQYGQRVRVTFVNDTMMDHPMHLHGMWMVLENGTGAHRPYKHTILVKGGEKLSFLATPDESGKFAFHCHLFFHMELGMFRIVSVSEAPRKTQP